MSAFLLAGRPFRPLRLADAAAILDPNSILTEDVSQVGAGLVFKVSDPGGGGRANVTEGAVVVWRARDAAGRPVDAPWLLARTDLVVLTEPGLSSDVVVVAGTATSSALAEWFSGGLHYTGGGKARRTDHHSASSSTSAVGAAVTRLVHQIFGAPQNTDAAKMRMQANLAALAVDDGLANAVYVAGAGQDDLTGTELYHFVGVYPTSSLAGTETVVVQARAAAVGMAPVETWDWMELQGEGVWCVGDSITLGTVTTSNGRLRNWRYQLLAGLFPRGPVRPVGHVDDNYSSWRAHSGVGGATAASTLAAIDTYLAGLQADPSVVTLMLGANDAIAAVSASAFGASMQGIVDAILAAHPAARIYVAYPTPQDDAGDDAVLQTYSAQIDALTGIAGVVDMRTDFNTGTMLDGDGVHVNDTGHDHIAAKWLAAVELQGEL